MCNYVRLEQSTCRVDRGTSNQIVLTGTAELLQRSVPSNNSTKTKYRSMGTRENTQTHACTKHLSHNQCNTWQVDSNSNVFFQLTQSWTVQDSKAPPALVVLFCSWTWPLTSLWSRELPNRIPTGLFCNISRNCLTVSRLRLCTTTRFTLQTSSISCWLSLKAYLWLMHVKHKQYYYY